MPQVSLYVDDAALKALRADAEREGVSLSKHVARRLRATQPSAPARCGTPSGMPAGFFERFFGCIDDDTFVRPEQPGFSLDAERLAFE